MKLKRIAFSVTLLLSIFVQLSFQLHHVFEEHELDTCSSNDIAHYCDHEKNDHEHYFDITLDTTPTYFVQLSNSDEIITFDAFQNTLLSHTPLAFSLRGPPHCVLS